MLTELQYSRFFSELLFQLILIVSGWSVYISNKKFININNNNNIHLGTNLSFKSKNISWLQVTV